MSGLPNVLVKEVPSPASSSVTTFSFGFWGVPVAPETTALTLTFQQEFQGLQGLAVGPAVEAAYALLWSDRPKEEQLPQHRTERPLGGVCSDQPGWRC